MPEYIMPGLEAPSFKSLDAFTRGYIQALFFTESEPGTCKSDRVTTRGNVRKTWRWGVEAGRHKDIPGDYGFDDLDTQTLADIMADCAKFQSWRAWQDRDTDACPDDEQGGMDFWYTRNGHGCGFWDGDWPEPTAALLTTDAQGFRTVDVYVGDGGKVYLA